MSSRGFAPFAREIMAGGITACVALPLCIAAGVLAYSPLGNERVAEGVIAGIISAILGGFISSVIRRSSFVTTIPTNPNALIQATLLGSFLVAFNGDSAPALLMFLICVGLAGLWQVVIGGTGLARILKLAPYPVIAGFVSGVGLLIILSQIPVFLPIFSFSDIGSLGLDMAAASRGLFGLGLVLAMLSLARWRPHVPVLLVGLVAGFAVYHAMSGFAPGIDLGPMIGVMDLSQWTPIDISGIPAVVQTANYDAWRILLMGSITLALVGTLDTVFSLHAARNMADIDVDQNRDLIGQGVANLATATAGGFFVSASMSVTSTNFQAGGRGRLSTITVALVLLAVAVFPQLIALLPRLVLAAILVAVGINIIDRWAIRMSVRALFGETPLERAQARRNSAVVFAVALATVLGQPVVGGAVGVALSCIVFMMEMNRPIVRRRETVASLRSKRIRSAAQHRLLTEKGIEAAVFELQGVLFFGNADDLETEIARLPEHVNLVVLDFRTVRNIDASGAVALQQIGARLERHDKRLYLSGLSDIRMRRAGAQADIGLTSFADLDAALEQSEEDIISNAYEDAGLPPEIRLEATDFGMTMPAEDLAILARHMQKVSFDKGTTLCNEGDASDRLWLLARGSVSVWVVADERRRRIASIGPGCTVGEMGLLNTRPRSADVCADDDVVAYELTAAALESISRNRPDAGHAILVSIARQLAERLRQSTQELRTSGA